MKKLCVLSILGFSVLAACASEDSGKVCDSSYIPTCNARQTAVITCREGVLVEEACANGCDTALNICKAPQQTQCTAATYQPACNSAKTGYLWCDNGSIKEQLCSAGQTCNDAVGGCADISANQQCTAESHPASCNGSVLTFCDNGTLISVTCGGSRPICDAAAKQCQSGGADLPSTGCDPSTFTPKCVTPHKLQSCVGGNIVTETCSTGTICNDALKNKSCKVPTKGEPCLPEAFAESCTNNDKSSIFCDEDTNKVDIYDCVKNIGNGYRCDIAENFYGDGLDVTMCFDPNDAKMKCSSPEETKSECEYIAKEDGEVVDKHFTTYYECAKFNLGYHFFVSEVVECGAGACKGDVCKD